MYLALLIFSTQLLLCWSKCPTKVADELQLISLPLECFRQLYIPSNFDNTRIQRVVTERLHTYQRMLQQLTMSDKQHMETVPVVKWAQNIDQIFISFKLSHRQDSPTCSDIRLQSFQTEEIQEVHSDVTVDKRTTEQNRNNSGFEYRGQCYFTSQKFRFVLAVQFEAKISKLTLRKEGLGLYILIGDKNEQRIWLQPFTNFKKAAIWTELREKYSGDMDKYFEQAEALADSAKSKKPRIRKRPKKAVQPDL